MVTPMSRSQPLAGLLPAPVGADAMSRRNATAGSSPRRRLPGPLAALLVLALAAVLFASALAGPALAQTAPAAPTGLTATPGDAQVVLNWTNPSDSTITKYQGRQSTDGGTTWTNWQDIASSDATTTTDTLTGLTNGTTYTFELRAVAGTTNGASASVSATPAAALVHNLGKQATGSNSVISNDAAQAFTTGSNAAGYRLLRVVLGMEVNGTGVTPTDYSVSIQGNNSSNQPDGTEIGDLIEPDALSNGGNTLHAAGTGIDLDPSTTYWIVFDSVSGGAATVAMRTATDTGESVAVTGWSIEDTRLSRARSTTTWPSATNTNPHKIGVYGYAIPDTTSPTAQRAELNRGANTVTITFDEDLKTSTVPAATQFQLVVGNSNSRSATNVSIAGNVVTVTYSGITPGATKIRYLATASPRLQDPSGNQVGQFLQTWIELVDYDSDDDGLIDINSPARLNAVRWDLDGDGTPATGKETDYGAAFPNPLPSMGCPSAGCTGYELTASINLDVAPYNASPWWTPLGTYTATFEGNGNTVANLTVDKTDTNNLGLFSIIASGARVRNLGLTHVSVTIRVSSPDTSSGVAALAGRTSGLVVASYSTGTVTCVIAAGATGECQSLGGLVGSIVVSGGEIRRSHSSVDVSGPATGAGGLAGGSVGTVKASYAAGDVTGKSRVGGLVGNVASATIIASYSIGEVALTGSGTTAGGLVGAATGTNTVTNSYYDSDTSGQSDTGKGVGKTSSELTAPTGYTGIYANWNLDLDNADNDNDHSTGQDDPWDFGTAQQYPGLTDARSTIHRAHAGPSAPAGLSATPGTDQVVLSWTAATDTTVTGYQYRVSADSGTTWNPDWTDITGSSATTTSYTVTGLTSGTAYTIELRAVAGTAIGASANVGATTRTDYDSDDDGLIDIDSAARLNAVRWDLNGDGTVDDSANQGDYATAFPSRADRMGCPASGCTGYELTADIDLDVSPYNASPFWSPIGDIDGGTHAAYTATFEGNGHTIDALKVEQTASRSGSDFVSGNHLGLFSELGSTAVVRNLGLTGASVTATTAAGNVGTFSIGVLAGENRGTVVAVYSTGTVTGVRPANAGHNWDLGGLVGVNAGAGAEIRRSHSTVRLSGAIRSAGGLVGENLASIKASYAAGDLVPAAVGSSEIGGLVGSNNFAEAQGTIIASYSVGNVGDTSFAGGLVALVVARGTVTDSYYNRETSGRSDTGAGEPLVTDELVGPTDYEGIYANWNLDLDGDGSADNPWRFGTAQQYPGLVDVKGNVHRPVIPGMTGLTGTPGNGKISLSWTNPSDSTITKYQVRQRAGSGNWSDWTDIPSSGSTTTSHEVTGLTNGTTYTVGVRAVAGSAIGASASVSATPAAQLVKNLDKSGAGAADTDIVANDAAQAFTTGSNGPGYALSYVILGAGGSGTPPGPSGYSVKVCNNDASGATHVPGTTCTDLSKPAALAGGGTDVFAAAAVGMSLSASTKYWVVFDSVSGGTGTWELRRTLDDGEDTGAAAGVTIANDGLTRARATTTWSTDNNPLKIGIFGYARTGPPPPGGLSAEVSRGQAALSWTAVTYTGVSKYQYRVSADGGTSWDPDWSDVPGGANAGTYTVRNLANGATHTIQVRAVAGTITGGAASVSADLPYLPAPAPGDLTATAGDEQIALTWTDPSDSAISKYQVRQRAGSGDWPDWTDVPTSDATTTTHTLTGLTNWTRYTVEVRAVRGTGALISSGASASVSAAPNGPLVSNIGQAPAGSLLVGPVGAQTVRVAQVFTTGDHAQGYRLTEIDVRFGSNTVNGNADLKASIFATTGDPPEPDTSGDALYELTNPATPADNSVGTLTAPANATLAANTSYALVLESATTKTPKFDSTTSDAEDAGTASGWSIANDSHESADGGAWTTDADLVFIAIKGTPRSPAPVFGGGGGGGSGPSPSTVDFEWTVKHDIEALHARHTAPTGMWSDGKTLWSANNGSGADDAVYAYDLESGERVDGREFKLDERNRAPRGVASDGVTVWVADSGRDRLFVYDLATGKRVEAREIVLDSGNRDARGAWAGDGVVWVLNRNPSLFAYDLESGKLLGQYALDARNADPRGIWSDGVTVWVSDHGAKQLFAYRLPALRAVGEAVPEEPPALERVPGEDFTELGKVSNLSPRGIWSDGVVMYVADANDGKVYSYNMPDAIDARLASLALEGVEIGEFDSTRTAYDGVPGEDVTVTVVTAEAAQDDATVAIEPPDADEATDGHQVALAGIDEITVTVTSADGSRTRAYRVAVEAVEQAWAHSLKGAVAEGFSLVVYEGGSVEALAESAQSRGVTAIYALHQGDYLAYILGAPAFVNRDFAELFTDGVPALTPLIVKSDGPPSGDPVGNVAAPGDWPACLHGEVAEGFSAVVYAGGSVEELAGCAQSLGVTSLYTLADGEWASYIPAAPAFVNRTFGELFTDGVPALTPFIVKGEEPVLASPAGASGTAPAASTASGSSSADDAGSSSVSGSSGADGAASTSDDTSAQGSASGQPATVEQLPARVIGNTGGVGVSHRDDCADEARLAGFGWADGVVVDVVADGDGRCEGWLQVRAGGVTSWVREQYLLPAS